MNLKIRLIRVMGMLLSSCGTPKLQQLAWVLNQTSVYQDWRWFYWICQIPYVCDSPNSIQSRSKLSLYVTSHYVVQS